MPLQRRRRSTADTPRLLGLTVLLACVCGGSADGAAAARDGTEPAARPNIVLIMADDMGFSDPGCYGGEIETPNLDRLAAEGLRFTQFYNCAMCGPTRAALLSGLYPQQVGVRNWNDAVNENGVVIAQLLQQAGYRTLMVGKWDAPPKAVERGFDRFFGFHTQGPISYFHEVRTAPFYLAGRRHRPAGNDFFITDALTDRALRFLETSPDDNRPFFLYVAYIAPHWPLHAKDKDIARYRERYRAGWDKLRQRRYQRQLDIGLVDADQPLPPRDSRVPPWDEAGHKTWQAERMAAYAAQVDRLDRNVGRILAQLDETGVSENTLVLFLSDNGASRRGNLTAESLRRAAGGKSWRVDGAPVRAGNRPEIPPGRPGTFTSYGRGWANLSNTPLRAYKLTCYEGGIATPLIARWPDVIAPGSLTRQVGHVIDVLPTCLELAGLKYPKTFRGRSVLPLEGKSLVPVLRGRKREGHQVLYWENRGNRAVRQGRWKLVARRDGPWELYDMRADRVELHNLAGQHPGRVRRLKRLWTDWARQAGLQGE